MRDGSVLAGSAQGAARWRGDRFEALIPGRRSAAVQALHEARDGCLWMGASDGEVLRLCNASVTAEHRLPAAANGLPVQRFAESPQGRMYVVGGSGAFELDAAQPRLLRGSFGLDPLAMAAFPDGSFLLRNNDGNVRLRDATAAPDAPSRGFPAPPRDLLHSAPDGALWTNAVDAVWRDGIPAYEARCGVLDLMFDRGGAVWLATGCDGLVRLRPRRVQALATDPADPVYGLAQTADGALWVSGRARGITRWREGRNDLTLFTREAGNDASRYRGIDRQFIRTLFVDTDGSLWVGQHGVCRVQGEDCVWPTELPEALLREDVRALFRDREGTLWIGGKDHLWHGRDSRWEAMPNRREPGLGWGWVRSIAQTRDGSLWFGTFGAGVARRSPEGTMRYFGHNEGLRSFSIRDLHEDAEGALWVVTEDRGVCRTADPAAVQARFDCLDSSRGLHADSLHRVIEDDAGRFWFNSNRGVFWIERAALVAALHDPDARVHPRVYGERDGLPDQEGNGGVQGAGLRLADGRIAFPGQAGVAIFDPARIDADAAAPHVAFEEIALNDGRRLPPTRHVTLPVGERGFAVRYTGLSEALTDPLYFRYRLLPDQSQWQDAGSDRVLRFAELMPGEHTLEVAALDAASARVGATQQVTFFLPPHWWETALFRWGALVCGAASLLLWIAHRGAQSRARERELEQRVVERTATVNAQREEIATLAAAKSRFFANVSHELRTPLAVILAPLRDATRGQPLEPARLEAMLRNGRRLERLVEQMLDLERIDARHFPLAPVDFDLGRSVREVGDAFDPLARGAGIAMETDASDVVPVHADPEQIVRVLGNLLSNALKFSGAGGRVRIALQADDDRVEVSVDDTGPGVPEAWRERIFDRFAQVGSAATRAREGAGLGLALCREIATLHGGRLHVQASPLGGARFVLRLPRHAQAARSVDDTDAVMRSARILDPDDAPVEPSPDAASSDSDGERARVLVVEDHADLRSYLGDVLSPLFEVELAADGRAALARAREWRPDLVISDVSMPEMDGFALARALRGDAELGGVPLIFLTARVADADEIQGLDLGADQYLRKPFDAPVLLAHLRAALHAVQRLRRRFAAEVDAMPRSPIREQMVTDATASQDEFTRRCFDWMTRHLHDESLDLDAIAAAMHVSRATLQRRFRPIDDEGVAASLRRLRLERGRDLLREGRGNVSEVAYAVGFRSLSAFSRAFREHFGHPPSRPD